MQLAMFSVVYRTLDKHSGNGQPSWGWLEHHHSNHRRTNNVTDDNMNVVEADLVLSSSHGANCWRLPQPTATKRIEVKIYTVVGDLLLIE